MFTEDRKLLSIDEAWQIAFEEARSAEALGEVPIGCCIIDQQGNLLARAGNRVEIQQNSCAHAEILALKQAMQQTRNWRLEGARLFVTLEPCPMCAGAILNSRVAEVHFAAKDLRLGACGSQMNLLLNNPINRKIDLYDGTHEVEAIQMLQRFFKQLRLRNKSRRQNNSTSYQIAH